MPPRLPTLRAGVGFLPTEQTDRRKAFDERRGSAASRGYGWRWSRAAEAFRREHPLCLGCQAVGRYAAAEVVDHVEPHKGDQTLFWDRDNWQSACAWHHDVVKQRLEASLIRGEIGVGDLRLDSEAARRLTFDLNPG